MTSIPDQTPFRRVAEGCGWLVFVATFLFFFFVEDEGVVERLAIEDGPIEWLTVVFLFLVGILAALRAFSYKHLPTARWSLSILAVLAFVFLGEEISWGQRVFGWETPQAIGEFNKQNETNFHNLHYGDFSLNRDLFGPAVEWSGFLYICFVPWISRMTWMGWLPGKLKFPIPRLRHQIGYFIAYSYMYYINGFDRRWEGLELMQTAMFFIVFAASMNDGHQTVNEKCDLFPNSPT